MSNTTTHTTGLDRDLSYPPKTAETRVDCLNQQYRVEYHYDGQTYTTYGMSDEWLMAIAVIPLTADGAEMRDKGVACREIMVRTLTDETLSELREDLLRDAGATLPTRPLHTYDEPPPRGERMLTREQAIYESSLEAVIRAEMAEQFDSRWDEQTDLCEYAGTAEYGHGGTVSAIYEFGYEEAMTTEDLSELDWKIAHYLVH